VCFSVLVKSLKNVSVTVAQYLQNVYASAMECLCLEGIHEVVVCIYY
jgi:hypothetical protein